MMNALPYLVPTFAVLLGVLFTRQDILSLRNDNAALRSELRNEINQLRSEFRADNAVLRSEMIQMRNSVHADMVGLHERIARVERQEG